MPSLDDLKKRIKSVKSTQKITKAMKMVAAAKLRKAQESAEKGRPYSQKMQNIILNLTKSINDPQNAPKLLVGTGEDKKYLCVVLTADRGLCGGFNSNICKLAKNNFKKILSEGKDLKIITVGSKGLDQIKREYSIGVKDGEITDIGEFQDAFGFASTAKTIAEQSELTNKTSIIAAIDELIKCWPSGPNLVQNPVPVSTIDDSTSLVMNLL